MRKRKEISDKMIKEYIKWTEKISMRSILYAFIGVILIIVGGKWFIDFSLLFIFPGWWLIMWAMAREVKLHSQ